MNVTLNGLQDYSNIVAFTGTPTILTVSDSGTSSSLAIALIFVQALSSIVDTNDYWIDINGHKIHSTNQLALANGQRFYLTGYDNSDNRIFVANSIARALNSVPAIAANYTVYQTYSSGTLNPIVAVQAKHSGVKYNITSDTNFPTSALYINKSTSTNNNPLAQGTVSNTVNLDIYKVLVPSKIGDTSVGNTKSFVTHLQKNYTDGDCSFNISPILSGICEYNQLSEYIINLYTISDNVVTNQLEMKKLFATTGYAVNQGYPFITKFTDCMLAQNVGRGEIRPYYNLSYLYVYFPNITFSLYVDNTVTQKTVTIRYMNSANNLYEEMTETIYTNNSLGTYTLNLNSTYLANSTYIDVIIPGLNTIRYNVIRPLNATDERDCQRIYWTNSYGGTSFFDFTGERTEQRKTSVDYYEKQLYDYYTSTNQERRKVYNKDVDITVTLTTHNIERDGTWQLFDLQNSTNAWTTINGKNYKITINDLAINESNNVNNIYTGQIKYEYSLADTL